MSQNLMAGRVSPHSTASRVFKWKKPLLVWLVFRVIGFPCFVLNCVYQGCQTQGPRAYFGPPHHFMWPARAYDCLTKTNNLCYFISYIMKVRINTTSFCFYLAFYLYAEIDFGVRMIRNGLSIDDDCVDGSKE